MISTQLLKLIFKKHLHLKYRRCIVLSCEQSQQRNSKRKQKVLISNLFEINSCVLKMNVL